MERIEDEAKVTNFWRLVSKRTYPLLSSSALNVKALTSGLKLDVFNNEP